MTVKGRIHSIETMGLVDGPGIRTVIFLQGCQLRCKYCHNPDTWKIDAGKEMGVDELIKIVKRYKVYYKNNGGVTISGGDPLLQPDFLLEFLKECKKEGIHTAIDTAGHGFGDYDEILKYTDLVLMDIKALDNKSYKEMTCASMDKFLVFLDAVKRTNTNVWIRHVLVPGINDSEQKVIELAEFINKIPTVEKVELLPYHTHGIIKYKELNMKYPLEGVKAMDQDRFFYLNRILAEHLALGHTGYERIG